MISNKVTSHLKARVVLLAVAVAGHLLVCPSQTRNESDTRGLKPREYAKAISGQIAGKRPQSSQNEKPLVAVYTAEGSDDSAIVAGVDVGITFWKLRYANSADLQEVVELQRITKRKQGQSPSSMVKMIAERTNAQYVFADGDLMRLSIEAPFEAYLYLLNRERYAGGSFSEPYLIYPSAKDAGVADRTMPGRLIFVPAPPDYFELSRLNEASQQKEAEVYTVILSESPIKNLRPLSPDEQIRKVRASKLRRWERKWGGTVWKFVNQAPRRRAITSKERIAMRVDGARLTGGDALPQTIYHVANKPGKPVLFTVTVPVRN
jgi:hypothetical protein